MTTDVTTSSAQFLQEARQLMARMNEGLGWDRSEEMDHGTLPVDIYAVGDELIVEASVPGFHKDDIAIQLHQGVLSILAQHPATRGENTYSDHRYYRRERPWGAWSRRVALPGIVHDAEVRGELANGVLRLRIPVPEAAKPKRIEIRTEGE